MPRFYFNYRNGSTIAQDPEGTELPGLEDARAMALESARELIGTAIANGGQTIPDAVIITDEGGKEVLTFAGKEALPDKLK
jgi:hypothetical protein